MWSFYLVQTPANTPASPSTGQIAELSLMQNRSMTFSLTDADTLQFSLPGRHFNTSRVEPFRTDILAYRDDYCVQRFRTIGSNLSKSNGDLTAQFSAISYSGLLGARLFSSADTRAWITPTEQTAIAWTLISDDQSKPYGDLAISRGLYPARAVNRVLEPDYSADVIDQNYFGIGKPKIDGLSDLAGLDDGFEFTIEPDRTNRLSEFRGLHFNTWNAGERRYHTPRSEFVLDDGGNVNSWATQVAPSDFANALYVSGQWPDGIATADVPPPSTWVPNSTSSPVTSADPIPPVPEGRWERAVSVDVASLDAILPTARGALIKARNSSTEWTVTMAPGRWTGPASLWVGDTARVLVDDGPISVDDDMRVMQVSVALDENGLENVSVALDRTPRTYGGFRDSLERRLLNLERR